MGVRKTKERNIMKLSGEIKEPKRVKKKPKMSQKRHYHLVIDYIHTHTGSRKVCSTSLADYHTHTGSRKVCSTSLADYHTHTGSRKVCSTSLADITHTQGAERFVANH